MVDGLIVRRRSISCGPNRGEMGLVLKTKIGFSFFDRSWIGKSSPGKAESRAESEGVPVPVKAGAIAR